MARPLLSSLIAFVLLVGLTAVAIAAAPPLPAPAAVAPAPPVARLEGRAVVIKDAGGKEAHRLELGCDPVGSLRLRDRLYVACGPDGVVVVALSEGAAPRLLGRRVFDGRVEAVIDVDGAPWLKISRLEARPLGPDALFTAAPGAAPVAPTPPAPGTPAALATPAAPPIAGVGRVLESDGEVVVIDLGTRHGLARDDHVELFRVEVVDLGGETVEQEVVVAVGEVLVASEDRARVRLGSNEAVPADARARRSERPLTESVMAPPRVADSYEVGFMVRPFIPLSNLGLGLPVAVWGVYRLEEPVSLRLRADPISLGFGDGDTIFGLGLHLLGALDLPLFEIGLGVGYASVNAEGAGGWGFSIEQHVRLGALDGLHFDVDNSFVFFEDQFLYGGTFATFRIPLSAGWWMNLAGGWRQAGTWLGELGMRVRLSGNGHRGSLFLSASVGVAGVFGRVKRTDPGWGGQPYVFTTEEQYYGPMIGFGMEWRM
jgi:hypothetical protein